MLSRFHTAFRRLALVLALAASPLAVPREAAAQPGSIAATADSGLPAHFPAARRIVAIGDLHGDLDAARKALRLAGAIDDSDRWIGKELVVVQTGDQLDRGDSEMAILELFERLQAEARETGGAVHVLNGNHELMNVAGDFRYVTKGGFRETYSALEAGGGGGEAAWRETRRQAFSPGGTYARLLGRRNMIVVVGDNVFVHGGVLPQHVALGLERINTDMRRWLRGNGPRPAETEREDSPVWTRAYSGEGTPDCESLGRALTALGAKRMIVGHSVQEQGINDACSGQVWRIDVGMAKAYGGKVQVLEIAGERVTVLR